jgi:prepilin-type N-terminal cleavage/methylation domain-containing protein
MSTARVDRNSRRAFTLLEITLAVVILGMMALAIYRLWRQSGRDAGLDGGE